MWASCPSQSLSNQDLILSEPNVNPVGIQNHIAALIQIVLSPSWLRDDTNAYKISISTEFFNILWQLVIPSLSTFYYKELNKCLRKCLYDIITYIEFLVCLAILRSERVLMRLVGGFITIWKQNQKHSYLKIALS